VCDPLRDTRLRPSSVSAYLSAAATQTQRSRSAWASACAARRWWRRRSQRGHRAGRPIAPEVAPIIDKYLADPLTNPAAGAAGRVQSGARTDQVQLSQHSLRLVPVVGALRVHPHKHYANYPPQKDRRTAHSRHAAATERGITCGAGPTRPFLPTSWFGCLIFDTLIACWFFSVRRLIVHRAAGGL
jgi:hypothetical protein